MSFFDSMKKSLGISKPAQNLSKGHVLGTRNPPPTSAAQSTSNNLPNQQSSSPNNEILPIVKSSQIVKDEFWEFELEFTADKMGMSIQEHKRTELDGDGKEPRQISQAMVAIVTPNSQAHSLGKPHQLQMVYAHRHSSCVHLIRGERKRYYYCIKWSNFICF
jgi:hypothetical protein